MTAKPYLIANMRTGLERDMEPWLIPEDAYPNLSDVYLFRGRIQRRRGFVFLGRLITTVGGVDTINSLPVMGLRTRELSDINVEQLIAFDTTKANAYSNFTETFQDITFYKTTGTAFSWTGRNSDFFWTENYLNAFWATNNVAGFQGDPTASAGAGDGIRWYDGTGWVNFMPAISGAVTVAGTTYLMGALLIFSFRGRLVCLNTKEGTAAGVFTTFRQRARWSQNGTPYPSQGQTGVASPLPSGYAGGSDDDAWRTDIVGKGGFIDAPTQEAIVSAQFFRDNLIVFFERSTWQLRYTGNELLPFIWERVNVELGVESTFSMVPFDAGIIGVGNYGIMTCDSTGVKRIDQIIPDEVFNIHNDNDGPKRVYGIRDYTQQLVYWTFPNADSNPTFPNKVLVYNYLEGSYSFFNDSITCFGYFQPGKDTKWQDLKQPWSATPEAWDNGQYQSNYPLIVAGNQQGYVLSNYNRGEITNDFCLSITGISNAAQAVITCVNHNFTNDIIIIIDEVVGMNLVTAAENTGDANAGATSYTSNLLIPPIEPSTVTITCGANIYTDDGIGNLLLAGIKSGTINYSTGFFTITFTALAVLTTVTANYTSSFNKGIFAVEVTGANTFKPLRKDENNNLVYINTTTWNPWASGGQIKIRNNFLIQTKRFNPFIQEGNQLRLQNIDYFIETDDSTEFTSLVFIDENDNTGIEQDAITPFSNFSGKVWVRVYYSAICQLVQIQLYFDREQMFDPTIPDGDITIHAMMLWMSRSGRLTYGQLT